MAPLKTYSRLNDTNGMKHSIYNSVAEPTFKKRKRGRKKIVIPDLPPPSTLWQLSDNSLKVHKEDSFDRLLKTSNHNSIHFKSKLVSSSDSSYDVDRYRSLKVKEPFIEIINCEHSVVTKKTVKTTQKNEKTYSVLNSEKSVGTSIESSLEIEVVRKAKPLIDSSLGLTNSSMNLQKSINNSTTFEPVLCKSFQNVPAICSTPIEPEKQKFINQTISPITTNNFTDSLVLSKGVSNTRGPSDALTPTSKPKPDDIKEPVNVEISGGKTNRRISYITIRKRKIFFTPIALLTKRRLPRLRDNSSNSNDMNNDSSNLKQNQKTNNENSRSHSSHVEVTDLIENSLDDGLQHSKNNLQEKLSQIIYKTEPQIETQANPVYITLRNRKKSSKRACRALGFGNSDTFEGQSIYKDVTRNSKENKSSSIFSSESSCNDESSSKTDITNATSKIQQIENSSACYESTNLERSHNSSYPYAQNNRFEEVSFSIESVNTTENTNFCENTRSNVENAVSTVECEENSISLIPINYSNLALNSDNTHEDTHYLGSIKHKSLKSQSSNLKQSTSFVYGESMCDSNVEKSYKVNVRRSKRNKNKSTANESSISEMTTGNGPLNSENNFENNFSENKKTVSQFEEPENVSVNSRTSLLPPMEVIVNIGSDTIEDTDNFNLEALDEPSMKVENTLDDRNQNRLTTRLSASVIELEESSQYSTLLNSPANKTEGLENVHVNSRTSVMRPSEIIVNIKRSNTIEDMVKSNFNLENSNNTGTDVENSLDNRIEQEPSTRLSEDMVNLTLEALTDTGSNVKNSLDYGNQHMLSTRLSASVIELEESSQYSTLLNSPANKNASQIEEFENVHVNSRTSVRLPSEVIINIKRSDTIEDMIKNNFNLKNSNNIGTGVENSLDNGIEQEPSTRLSASVVELKERSKYSTSLNSDITPEINGSNALKNVLIKNNSNLEEEEEESLIIDSFKSLHLNKENEEGPLSVVEVKENSKFINFIKLQPIINIKKTHTVEKLLKAQSAVENQTILQRTERQSETLNSNEPFRGFACDSIQQQSPESTPLHRDISNAAPEYIQSSNNHTMENVKDFIFALPHTPTILKLKPGKPYRRSLLQIRNSSSHFSPDTSLKTPAFPFQEGSACIASTGGICTCAICKRQSLEHLSPRRVSVRFMPVSPSTSKKSSTLQNYAAGLCKGYNSDVFQESLLENYFENLSLTRENLEVTLEGPCREPTVTAREIVLRRCGQTEPLPFEKCYPNSVLQHCHKIGEGVYGEVFLFRNQNGGTTVMKIIPIEGDQIINGEKQKKFDEIISEIIIAMELSNLRNGKKNNTTGFNELYKICCVQGKYPERLLELWELYEEGHGTENDSPEIFPKDQLYIVLELANGGKDLEAFVFNNAQQAYSIFIQTACAMAVAETALQFEHRDLHWGNILISNCDRSKKKVRCCIDGEEIELPTFGVEVAIIDYTLSRITHDGVCIYNDLSLDADLFTAKGDYQFDIYRLMKSSNGNQWQRFQPYTNVLWLHYILDKMITAIRYKNKKTRMHKEYLVKLEFLKQEILEYKSVKDIVNSKFTMASAL